MKLPTSVSTKWFFKETPWYVKATTLIFIQGDMFYIVPILIAIIASFLFISVKFGALLLGSFITIRFFGEMIYWLMQQFTDRSYCPPKMGFKHLDTNALYILYQTFALLGMMVGIAVILSALFLL